MEGIACILKDFFFDMNPVALRKAKIVYNLAFLSAIGLKEKYCAYKGHKNHIFLQYFLIFLSVGICILRKKKFSKK